MTYHVEWYIPYRVIDARFSGRMEVHELDHHTAMCAEMLTEIQAHSPGKRAYLILDIVDVESMPPIYRMVSRGMPVLRFKNRGPMFLITQKKAMRSIAQLAAHVMSFAMHTFGTRAEALQALEAVMLEDDILSRS